MSELRAIDAQPSTDVMVGRRVHQLMWNRQITQKDLAPKLGMAQNTLSAKIRGRRGWSLDELLAVAAEFSVSAAYLLGESNSPEPGGPGSRLWESNPRPSHYKGAGSRPVVSITSRKLVDAA